MSKGVLLVEKPPSEVVEKPPATSRGQILFAPSIELPHRFAANSDRAMECAVLRPIDLTVTHGVNVLMETIEAMAKDYNPAFEAGALNFDHSWGGPAHGLSPRIWVNGEFLWCRMEQLSDEAIRGISTGQWPRRSSEFWMSHPQTNRPYWCGLALLGSATPAVPGLPPAVLLSQRPIYRLISTGSVVEPSAPDASSQGVPSKEEAMKKKTAAAPSGAENETPETSTPETPSPEVETPEGDETPETPAPAQPAEASATPAQLAHERKLLQQEREASRKERLAAKQERAEASVDKLFTRLGTRVPPAAVKASRQLLVALASQLTPVTLKLSVSGKEQEVGIYEQVVSLLESLPENKFVNGPRLAEVTPGELAEAGPEAAAANSRAGITPERRAELAAKYPGTYGPQVN
jgi:hypothetical protein